MFNEHAPGNEHVQWKWTCTMDIDVQQRYGNIHAAWTWTWTCSMAEDMFHELHAAWT
jgi:hypothetical protein